MGIIMIKYWKEILMAIMISSIVISITRAAYTYGEQKTTAKYTEQIDAYSNAIDTKIVALQELTQTLISQNEVNSKALKGNLDTILIASKKQPMYNIISDKCTISPEFIDNYNKLINSK